MIDTHCHLDFEPLYSQTMTILNEAEKSGVSKIIVPSVSVKNWQKVLDLSRNHSNIYPAFGIHPCFAKNINDLTKLSDFLEYNQCVAIGECGLDFYNDRNNENLQKTVFEYQLKLAQKYNLPVIIHSLKAVSDVLIMIKKIPIKSGVLHSFRGSLEQMKQAIKLNLFIGIDGTIHNPDSHKIRKIAKETPLNRILLETDSPEQKLKNQDDGHPKNIMIIAQELAKLQQTTTDKILSQCFKNATECFSL